MKLLELKLLVNALVYFNHAETIKTSHQPYMPICLLLPPLMATLASVTVEVP
jgi:hypothetical protein